MGVYLTTKFIIAFACYKTREREGREGREGGREGGGTEGGREGRREGGREGRVGLK